MNERIWLSLAEMGGREQEFIQSAFDTNWVVPLGPNVDGFEEDLVRFLGIEGHRVVALSAGTAALHLALVMLGVGRDDEVICQSFTFSASANPIAYQGATPIFVDSEPETWNMDPELLEKAIKERIKGGKKPKAIIPVHLYGMPAKMDEICAIANRYEILVVEDSAEALGSEYKGKKCGTLGRFGALSFNGNKMITTSGGGALVCPDEKAAQRVMFFATQAREPAPHYQHEHIGYNYRLSNVSAGIGRGQMCVLSEHIAKRRTHHDTYTKLLSDVPGITVHANPSSDFRSNYWLTTIVIEPELAGFDRVEAQNRLAADNIESRPLWKPMHLQPVFKDAPRYTNGTSEALFDKGLCLPSGSSLTEAQIERVVSALLRK